MLVGIIHWRSTLACVGRVLTNVGWEGGIRTSSILPRQSGPPPAFEGANLGVDLQKKNYS